MCLMILIMIKLSCDFYGAVSLTEKPHSHAFFFLGGGEWGGKGAV